VIDDSESKGALRRAFELGVTFFDTADVYGCGHSEKLIASALGDVRDQIVIATKAGYTYDEETREAPGENGDPDYIRWACDQSLRRLGTEYIDLYQFHLGGYDLSRADEVLAVFEELVAAGKVRAIGWSTDSVERAAVFAKSEHCKAIQQAFNVFSGNADVLDFCEQHGLASIVRGPLGMGLLTGKFSSDSSLPADDVRHGWDFRTGDQAESLRRLDAIREILTTDGRTLAQGALGWLWARSNAFIPIPGFKTVAQVEENAGALDFGPLPAEALTEIQTVLAS
jgi:aryl-alcohol dehydrogenase-like predicted oxidoreductase